MSERQAQLVEQPTPGDPVVEELLQQAQDAGSVAPLQSVAGREPEELLQHAVVDEPEGLPPQEELAFPDPGSSGLSAQASADERVTLESQELTAQSPGLTAPPQQAEALELGTVMGLEQAESREPATARGLEQAEALESATTKGREQAEALEPATAKGPEQADALEPITTKAPEQVEAVAPATAGGPEQAPQPPPARVPQPAPKMSWRQRAPRWTAAMMVGLVVAEAVQLSWGLRGIALDPVPTPLGDARPRPRAFNWWRLASAHLFGVEVHEPSKLAAHVVVKPIEWALTGVIAYHDPEKGIAILGEKGKTLKVLRPGATLADVPEGHLVQVFADHVVIEVQGQTQELPLPRQSAAPAGRVVDRMAALSSRPLLPAPAAASDDQDDTIRGGEGRSSAAEELLSSLNPERAEVGGTGMTLHPARPVQRRFGLREGDVLTAINGVEVSDPAAVAAALKSAGDTNALNLTYTRDGVEQTVNVPVGSESGATDAQPPQPPRPMNGPMNGPPIRQLPMMPPGAVYPPNGIVPPTGVFPFNRNK